jgi:adenosylcobinamide kinase/adenosylcobinamide-phosphate guanylyltransferase
MILIIGGEKSGKGNYAESLGFDKKNIFFNIHELVLAEPEKEFDLDELLSGKSAVTCNEVGSGVIPATPEQRKAREAAGRICIKIAERAEKVVRMSAGIPTVIKG